VHSLPSPSFFLRDPRLRNHSIKIIGEIISPPASKSLHYSKLLMLTLLSHDSATLTLDRWCGDHLLASPAHIVANLVQRTNKKPTVEQRQLLSVSASEQTRYRRVRLSCGDHVLSEADNWYVPSRLTPAMNRILDTTDTSFGRVVRPLDFHRHTLSAKLLYSPLPKNWEMDAPIPERHEAALTIPHAVLEHRAMLTLPNGTPFSQVIETYTSEVLDFHHR
jgi:hypothetical protein